MYKNYSKSASKGKGRSDLTKKKQMGLSVPTVGRSNAENETYMPGKPPRKTACERDQELLKKGEENRQKKNQESEKEKPPAPKPEPQKPKPKVIPDEEFAKALKVEDIDFCIDENTKSHHTDEYECCQKRKNDQDENCEPELVIRRGDKFRLKIEFDRPYEKKDNDLRLIFWTGYDPKASRGTLAIIELDETGKVQVGRNKWGATLVDNKPKGVDKRSENIITVAVSVPATCPIGEWQLKIRTFDMGKTKEGNETTKLYDFISGEPFYILFNPWCKDDSVYYEKQDDLKEYILNQNSVIFCGTNKAIEAKPWNYGQFQEGVLNAALFIVRFGFGFRIDGSTADPVRVARAISQTVQEFHDDEVFSGNWNGSVKILTHYMDTGSPVNFGQCLVFSGVTTTVCRAIGIPARSITNFCSALDRNGNCTIDTYLDFCGDPKEEESRPESVRPFHVWNDVWMARPDLPGYDGNGWQAIDAYPQETIEGERTSGPAPLKAIKNGDNIPFDTLFIYAQVNGDCLTWVEDLFDGDQLSDIKTNRVGKNISTKIANCEPFAKDKGIEYFREDITHLYKYKEGSTEERESALRANRSANNKGDAYRVKTQDQAIKFRLQHRYDVLVGEPLEIKLTAKNLRKMTRTIKKADFKLFSCNYKGFKLSEKPFKHVNFPGKSLNEKEECEFAFTLMPEEYEKHLGERGTIKIEVVSTVEKQEPLPAEIKFKCHDFRFQSPDLVVKPKQTEVKVGDRLEVVVSWTNPLHRPLTDVVLSFESCAFRPFTDVKIGTIKARTEYKGVFTLIPKCRGEASLQFSLDSNELQDAKGTCCVCVKK